MFLHIYNTIYIHKQLAEFHSNDIDCMLRVCVYVNHYLQFEHISIGSDVSFPCKKAKDLFLIIILQMCVSKYYRALQPARSSLAAWGPKAIKVAYFFAQYFSLNSFFLTRTNFFITILCMCFFCLLWSISLELKMYKTLNDNDLFFGNL